MPNQPNVALVGVGHWGKNILRDLVDIGCEVSAVARSEESVARAKEGGASRVVPTIGELDEPEGIVIAVPTTLHAEVALESLELSVPVYVEKPLTNDVTAAEQFKGRDDVFVMDKWRYHGGVLAIKDLIEAGKFGEMHSLRTLRHSLYNPHHDVDSIWVLSPHDVSIVLELMGKIPPPIAATGTTNGIESSIVGILEERVSIDVSTLTHVVRREVTARFDDAVVTLGDGYSEALDVRITRPGHEPDFEEIPIPVYMPLKAELKAFVDHLRGGPPPKSSADEGIRVVKTIQRLRDLAGI